MFTAEDVSLGSGSKYQQAGVSEKVKITEFKIIDNINGQQLQFSTENEQEQAGQSKRLSLKTDVSPGKTISGWKVSAKYLLGVIMSATGKTLAEAQDVLKADSVDSLKKNLERTLIGKQFRGLFSSREYQVDKFAVELYSTEPVGGTRLKYDETKHSVKIPKSEGVESTVNSSGFPF